MNKTIRWWMVLVLLLAIAAGTYWYLTQSPPEQAPAEVSSTPEAPPTETVRHPIDEIGSGAPAEGTAAQELPPLDASDTVVEGELTALFDGGPVLNFVGSGDYISRLVATVDNLASSRTSARLWPVQPTPGRLAVRQDGDRTYLSTENFQRYAPFVRFATSVDVDRLVALYVRYYPLFQQAYESLGYPDRYFNDRVVDVIDDLLATPDPGGSIELVLPPQDPSVEVRRPWVLYQYADPALESLSAGQKILIRMGSENAGLVKATLRDLRTRLATAAPPAAAPPGTPSP
jgi:hypothetical protein